MIMYVYAGIRTSDPCFPLISLANANIQYKQINYDADKRDKNK